MSEEQFPPQHQRQRPGREGEMEPAPVTADPGHRGSGRLDRRRAIITGGDSGIGRAVAVAFAREGADVAIVYLEEDEDAEETRRMVEAEGRTCTIIRGDIGDEAFSRAAVARAVEAMGGLDVVVNNAAEQHPQKDLREISAAQLESTFRTNVFGMFFITKAALEHLGAGSAIINTTSVTAYKGSPGLLDYSATKGAIVSFTRSLSQALVDKGIRVNAVAPGPIWTPLIPSTFSADEVEKFGSSVPMKRAGQPEEVAACFVFLAGEESSYLAGQVLHPNGGEVVGG